ncbi:hypothetical protein PFISCL1PPCAC_14663, partial [Pristionchus fissidentatus]
QMITRSFTQLSRITVSTVPSTSHALPTVLSRGYCGKINNCWSCLTCKNSRSNLFCDKCGQLQPPSKVNLFEYVGMTPQFDIDEMAVKRRLIQLSAKIHPDKFSTASQQEKDLSEEHTRLVSTARSMLSDPVKRSRYLIQLSKGDKQIHVEDDDVQSKETFSPEVLMEIFELNERVEDATSEKEKEEILNEIGDEKREIEKRITNAFNGKKIEEAEKETSKLAYLMSIKKRLLNSIRG